MQRFVNDPDMIVDDMLKGYVKCHKAVSYTHLPFYTYGICQIPKKSTNN